MHTPKDNQKRTLDRVLSKFGVGSRTEARSWIGAGRVTVNGKKVQIQYLSQTEVRLTADEASRTVVIKRPDSPVRVRLKNQ